MLQSITTSGIVQQLKPKLYDEISAQMLVMQNSILIPHHLFNTSGLAQSYKLIGEIDPNFVKKLTSFLLQTQHTYASIPQYPSFLLQLGPLPFFSMLISLHTHSLLMYYFFLLPHNSTNPNSLSLTHTLTHTPPYLLFFLFRSFF